MASLYGVYHGPEGLKRIATRVHEMTALAADALASSGFPLKNLGPSCAFFDTFCVDVSSVPGGAKAVARSAADNHVNVRVIDESTVGISFGKSQQAPRFDHSLLTLLLLSRAQSLFLYPPSFSRFTYLSCQRTDQASHLTARLYARSHCKNTHLPPSYSLIIFLFFLLSPFY
jgi:hypothetical protein